MQMKIQQYNPSHEFTYQEICKNIATKAYIGVLMKIKNQYDALYFFSCMNLLNAYVKQGNSDRELISGYKFKDYIVNGIEQILLNQIKDVKIYFCPSVVYITLFNLQFSFHNVKPSYFLNKQFINTSRNEKQEWSNIKLQPFAVNIFEWAEQIRSSKDIRLERT